jgi:hypothetical protein
VIELSFDQINWPSSWVTSWQKQKAQAAAQRLQGPKSSAASAKLAERIGKYIDATPPAKSGQRGHDQTFALSCALVHGFGLSADHALEWLKYYNQKCEPPWNERDLKHEIQDAAKRSSNKPGGYLLNAA